MDTDFRLATETFIPDILAMMSEFYAADNYHFEYDISQQNLRQFLESPGLGRLWLIYSEEKVVGYIVLVFGFSFEYKGECALIDELYIKKEFRKRGVGQAAMEFIEFEASLLGIKALQLEVETDNENAKNLYANQYFKGNGRTLMTKSIES